MVKRYQWFSALGKSGMQLRENGNYVLFTYYEALQRERDELNEALNVITDSLGMRGEEYDQELARADRLEEALKMLVSSCEINTGHEPSLSCYERALDEAKAALAKGSEQ